MTEQVPDGYAGEMWAFERRRRQVYTIAGAAGVVVTALSWLTRDSDDVMIAVIYPVLAVALVFFLVALRRRWLSLAALEVLILGVMTAVILGRLAWHLHLGGHIDEHLLVLTGGHYWAVAVLIVAGFVLLDRRRGLRFGVAVLVASVVLVVTGAGPELVGPDGSGEALLYLIRLHGFLVMLLVLVTAVATLRTQLHRALARAEVYEELATTDPLTGLANRRAAVAFLAREVQVADRRQQPLSILALDLDHFKAVNDRHGHAVGDEVLADVATVLRGEARDVDLVARWGGEEFLVVAPGAARRDAVGMAERLRRRLADAAPGGQHVTATIGVAQRAAGEDVEGLLIRADQLLYDAKRAGRNQVLGDDAVPSRTS